MPRKTRIDIVRKCERREQREREASLRELAAELRRQCRKRGEDPPVAEDGERDAEDA